MRLLGYFTLLIAFVGTMSTKWEAIERLEDTLGGINSTTEDLIKKIENIIQENTLNGMNFIKNIDELIFVKEVKSLPDNDLCKANFTDTALLKKSFLNQFHLMTVPLVKSISDIRSKLNMAASSVHTYKLLANGKSLSCNVNKTECYDEINDWVEDGIEKVMCSVIYDCQYHSISKRYIPNGRCGIGQFDCGYYYRCISVDYICDGSCNCDNCKDEVSGCSKYCINGFHCRNGQCKKKTQVCDGNKDCRDGSDESDCAIVSAPNKCTFEDDQFLCSNRRCVNLSDVCNGKDDCRDGSDEGGSCFATSCDRSCTLSGGVCFNTPNQVLCLTSCPSGYSEVGSYCLPGARLPPATLNQALEQLRLLSTRFVSSYKAMERRVIDELSEALSNVSKCKSGQYFRLNKIISLSDINNRTTTHRPHTTTKHWTTSHRPHTTTTEETTSEDAGNFQEIFYEDV